MPYCTQTDIVNLEMTENELIRATDDKKLNQVDTAKVTAAILKADADIDAYCQAQYTVPFTTVPTIVMGWSATLAAFNLYRNQQKPATLLDRYNKAMSWLSAISEGKRSIPGVTADNLSLPGSTTDGAAQVFRQTQRDVDGVLVGDAGTMDVW